MLRGTPASRLPQPLASHHDPCAASLALLMSTWPRARSKVTKCPIRRALTVTTVHNARRHKRACRRLQPSLSHPGQSQRPEGRPEMIGEFGVRRARTESAQGAVIIAIGEGCTKSVGSCCAGAPWCGSVKMSRAHPWSPWSDLTMLLSRRCWPTVLGASRGGVLEGNCQDWRAMHCKGWIWIWM